MGGGERRRACLLLEKIFFPELGKFDQKDVPPKRIFVFSLICWRARNAGGQLGSHRRSAAAEAQCLFPDRAAVLVARKMPRNEGVNALYGLGGMGMAKSKVEFLLSPHKHEPGPIEA